MAFSKRDITTSTDVALFKKAHTNAYLHDYPNESSKNWVNKAVTGLLVFISILSFIGLVASGIAFREPLETRLEGASIVQAFVFLAVLLFFIYLGVHVYASRKNCPIQVGYGHPIPHKAHVWAIIMGRLTMGAWSVALIASSVLLARIVAARKEGPDNVPSSPIPYLDFVVSILACPAFGMILLAIEKAHDPFCIPGLKRQSTLTCRVSGLAADFLSSRPTSSKLDEKRSLRSSSSSGYRDLTSQAMAKYHKAEVESVDDEYFIHAREQEGDIERYPIIQPIGNLEANLPAYGRSAGEDQPPPVPAKLPKKVRPSYSRHASTESTPAMPQYRPFPPSARIPVPPPTHHRPQKPTSAPLPALPLPPRTPSGAWGKEWSQLVEETGFNSPSPSLTCAAWSAPAPSHPPLGGFRAASGTRQPPQTSAPNPDRVNRIPSTSKITSSQAANINPHQLPVLDIPPPHLMEDGLSPCPGLEIAEPVSLLTSPPKRRLKPTSPPRPRPEPPSPNPSHFPVPPRVAGPRPLPHHEPRTPSRTRGHTSSTPPSLAPRVSPPKGPRPQPSSSASNLLKQAQANLRARKTTPTYPPVRKSPLSHMTRAEESPRSLPKSPTPRPSSSSSSSSSSSHAPSSADKVTYNAGPSYHPSPVTSPKLATRATSSKAKIVDVRSERNERKIRRRDNNSSSSRSGLSSSPISDPSSSPSSSASFGSSSTSRFNSGRNIVSRTELNSHSSPSAVSDSGSSYYSCTSTGGSTGGSGTPMGPRPMVSKEPSVKVKKTWARRQLEKRQETKPSGPREMGEGKGKGKEKEKGKGKRVNEGREVKTKVKIPGAFEEFR